MTEKSNPKALRPGDVVDHFVVRHRIGRGGFGTVYLARDMQLGRRVALKVVRRSRLGDQRSVEAFLREARITAQFNHPSIVTVYGVGEHEGQPYVALEFVEGRTLREEMQVRRIPVSRAIRITCAIAEGLAEAHAAGVLHRDLKPENILLGHDGRCRVADFGLACGPDDTDESPIGGTPAYFSPESWRSTAPTAAADIWALGVVFFEMLAGFHPFGGTDASAAALRSRLSQPDLAPPDVLDLSKPVHEVLVQMLAVEPSRRPAPREILDALAPSLVRVRPEEGVGPFRGLLAFGEQDAPWFFGRDAEANAFVERLRDTPTLTVVGPSGTGKSSFALAGVVPRLRDEAYWIVVHIRPGRDPFTTLAQRLLARDRTISGSTTGAAETLDSWSLDHDGPLHALPYPEDETDPNVLARRLQANPRLLAVYLQQLAEAQRGRVLLLVDQLEEVQTLVTDDHVRRSFLIALFTAAEDSQEPVRVITTVRDDFLGQVAAEDRTVADALARVFVLRPLDSQLLADTLQRPVSAAGFQFDDPKLVDEMVADVEGEAAALPLLQFAARALWERRDRAHKLIRREDYDALGGVAGALAGHADAVIAGLEPEQRSIARALLLRLVTADGTRRVLTRPELLTGLPLEAAEPTLDRLLASRLLAQQSETGTAVMELAHEALVGAWAQLARWLDESRSEVRVHNELVEAARLWEQRGARPEELWTGDALAEAERFVHSTGLGVDERVRRFVEAGVLRRERDSRRRGVLLAVLGGVLVVAALVSMLAAAQYARQTRIAEAARSEALATSARAAAASGDLIEARARLRSALAQQDSKTARGLWWDLRQSTLTWELDQLWSADVLSVQADGLRAVVSDLVRVRLVDLATGELRPLRFDPFDGAAAGIDPTGRQVAITDRTGRVWIWDLETDEMREAGQVRDGFEPWAVYWFGDGRLLIHSTSPDWTRTLLTWVDPTQSRVDREQQLDFYGTRVALSPRGDLVAASGPGGRVFICDSAGQRELEGVVEDRPAGLEFSADGRRLLVAGWLIQEWDTAKWELLRQATGFNDDIRNTGYTADGNVWLASYKQRLIVVDPETDTRIWESPASATDTLHRAVRIPGSNALLIGQRFGMRLVQLGGADPRRPGHSADVQGLDFSADGTRLASAGVDGRLRVRRARDGKVVLHDDGEPNTWAYLRFGGSLLGSTPSSNELQIWNEALDSVGGVTFPESVTGFDFDPERARFYTADQTGELRAYSYTWKSGALDIRPERTWRSSAGGLSTVAVLQDGRVAYGDHNGGIGIQGDGDHTLADVGKWIHTLVAAREAPRLASATVNGSVAVHDLHGETLFESEAPFTRPAISANGELVGYGTGDGAVLRNIDSGNEVHTIGLASPAKAVALNHDSSVLATGTQGVVQTWEAATGEPIWRTIAASEHPPAILTHLGWQPLSKGEVPDTPWAGAFASARVGHTTAEYGCLLLRGGGLQGWDLTSGVDFREPLEGGSKVVTSGRSCAVISGDQLVIANAEGVHRLHGDWVKVSAWNEGFVGIDASRIRLLTEEGTDALEIATGIGTTAALAGKEELWVGYQDGQVSRYNLPDGRLDGGFSLDRPPGQRVEVIYDGPAGSLITGHTLGDVVFWERETGVELTRIELHGYPTHAVLVGPRMLFGSITGEVREVDMSAIEQPWSELLEEVQREVQVVWENGRAVRADPSGG